MNLFKRCGAYLKKPGLTHIAAVLPLGLCVLIMTAVFISVSHEYTGPDMPFAPRDPVSLEGEWKLKRGDVPSYAAETLDDSSWETAVLPANTAGRGDAATAFQWLRRQVFIPAKDQGAYDAITLGAVHAADEVYFNGRLVGSTGSMTEEWQVDYDKIRVYPLPPDLIHYGGVNTVAVRVRSIYTDIAGIYRGPLAIGNFTYFMVNTHMRDMPLLIVVCIMLFSGIIFILFSFFKLHQGSDFLLFGIFLLLIAIFGFSATQMRLKLQMSFVLDKQIKFSVLAASLPFFMRFLYLVIVAPDRGTPPDRLAKGMDAATRWLFVYPAVYISYNLIVGDMRVFRMLDGAVNDKMLYLCAAVSLLLIIYKSVRGRHEAWFLLAGAILMGATVIHDLVVSPYNAGYTYAYSAFGVLPMILSGNLILINRLRALQIGLEQANLKIAGQNQTLEIQVAKKTKDLTEANCKLETGNRELTELNEMMRTAQAELVRAASTDSLTGLYNRFELDKRLHHEMKAMERYGERRFEGFALIYMDIDNFKYINDTFGHQAGDRVLILFADILKSAARSSDIASRYGGDEFILLMPGTGHAGAEILAQRIAGKLEEENSFQREIEELKMRRIVMDPARSLRLSYGIAIYREGASMDDLIKAADISLYAMKESHRAPRTPLK